ncbi:HYR domain-containing protein, partial [Seonamhaeicola maritimus]
TVHVQTLTVQDTTGPTVSAPTPTPLECDSDLPAAVTTITDFINLTGAGASDNCTATNNLTISSTTGPLVNNSYNGTITRTYTITDACGNSTDVDHVFNINDTTNPVISCPSGITVNADPGVCNAAVTIPLATATDNCLMATITNNYNAGGANASGTFPVGTTTVTYTATDAAGNTASCSINVTVVDNENPTITCPADDITVNNNGGECSAIVTYSVPFDDNCSGSTISQTAGLASGGTFPIGTTTNSFTVTDAAGNTASCSFTVTVIDNEAPTIACPLDINVNNDAGECTAIVNFATPNFDDNCPGASITQIAGLPSGSAFPVGTTTITYRATDTSGLTTDCSFNVNVTDNEDPAIIVLPDLTDECSVTISSAPTTTDNCAGTVTGTTGDFSIPYTFSSQGNHTINWQFDDGNGNSFVLTQNVIINDITDPVPDAVSLPDVNVVDCEVDVTVPTATDNCRGTINGDATDANGNDIDFPITTFGTTVITWTYDDRNGQTVKQQQNVTLTKPAISGGALLGQVDTLDPIEFPPTNNVLIAACPDNINPVTIDLSGHNGTIVQWEQFEEGAQNWNIIANTTATHNINFDFSNSLSSVFRVLIQWGTCYEYSQILSVHAVPPDVPPLLEEDYFNTCFPNEVSLTAHSGYGGDLIDPEDEDAGQFDQGQFPDKWNPNMWKIDGQVAGVAFTGAANNRSVNNWTATNNHPFPDGTWSPKIEYDSNNFKFAIAQGDYTSQEYIDEFPPGNASTLETPIMSLLGLESPTFSFTQAWNLFPGDTALLEISLDGGLTYEPLPLQDLTDPIVPWDWASYPPSTSDNYIFDQSIATFDLSAYSSYDQVRIKWTFFGTSPFSAWAIDEITLPLGGAPADEIEWTDGIGDPTEEPLADGTLNVTYTFTPDAPGFHQYGATILVNGCRAYDPAGTALADVIQNYAYAGEDVVYAVGECGENLVTLNAYDNTKSAVENAAKGAYKDALTHADLLDPDCKNCDDPGTMSPGKWTVVSAVSSCGGNSSFSDDTDPDATFTGDPGTYTLRWTVGPFGLNNEICSDDLVVEITNCSRVDFDGENDNVTFRNNYNLGDEFSIECWIKPDATSNTGLANNTIQTIISKRDASDFGNQGYDLRLEGSTLSFNWNNTGSLVCPYPIDTNRWYHIAVTRTKSGKNYVLYVDGIQVASTTGNPPTANSRDCILGAMDQTGNPPNPPVNYFSGWIDEVRIWNMKLSVDHIRHMMNQQIVSSGTNVIGEVIPLKVDGPDANGDGADDNPVTWANLDGYYRMDNISCGYLQPYSGKGVDGKLQYITTQQDDSAPLPYTSKANGNWNDTTGSTPWTYGDTVWDHPNSNGVNGDPIDWNIVRTGHNITSNTQNLTLLGLLVDTAELTVTNTGTQDETNPGHALNITRYLRLDGLIDLVGESQLIQKRYYFDDDGNPNNDDVTYQISGSILDTASSGHLERDQQGQSNLYNYNYWSSPVSENGVNGDYSIANVLKDGSDTNNPIPLDWTSGRDAIGSTTPVTMSRRWLYNFKNDPTRIYANWEKIQETTPIPRGLSFTMKGSGDTSGTVQNYVFDGLPYNGTITTPITNGNEALVGNPYPSAFDAREFILDNIPGGNPGTSGSIDGALYFWIHYVTNDTHILRDYQGGFAQLTLAGGNPAAAPPLTIDGYEISGQGNSGKIPEYYIPVGQGFVVFATGAGTGGNVTFHNKHRIFKTEQGSDPESIFMKQSSTKEKINAQPPKNSQEEDDIQRVRLLFRTPEGAKRHLLLGFTPDNTASDGFDFGYDAISRETFPNDMLFRIDDKNYMIQGVGEFDEAKQYPVGIFSTTGGPVEIHLTKLENLSPNTKVYVYDALLGNYTKINNKAFEMTLDPGDYLNRFYITFTKHNTLSDDDNELLLDQVLVNYLHNSREIHIKTNSNAKVKQVYLTNFLGQTVKTWNVSNTPSFSNNMKIPVGNVAEGSYIIKVQTELGSANKKVVISQ